MTCVAQNTLMLEEIQKAGEAGPQHTPNSWAILSQTPIVP